MDIWRSLSGAMDVSLTSADPNGALLAIQNAGITIMDIESDGALTLRFRIGRHDGRRLADIAEKRGETVRVCRRVGLFWSIRGLTKRPVLVLGMLVLLSLSLWVPSRVFFVRVEGNASIPDAQIIEAAQKCGIGFGASRREVRSEVMKNMLLSAMPELQWAGVNTYGCIAVITVRERKDEDRTELRSGVSSIVAIRDGVIREMSVLRGNGLCKPGQAVKAGQVLISGYTDYGICIGATRAEGEIFAETRRELTAVFPTQYDARVEITGSGKKYSLIIGKKRINFSKGSGISDSTCAKIYTENYLTLPGGFRLPVALVTEKWISYRTEAGSQEDGQSNLQSFSRQYLRGQMLAGKMESANEVFTQTEGLCRLDGIYGCYEMIGITRTEEIMIKYGESN